MNLGGIPLIAWSVKAAKNARRLSRVVVSTDCPKIRAAAESEGADSYFLRPAEFATDTIANNEVMRHMLGWLKGHGKPLPELMLLLQPTSPFRTARNIDEIIENLLSAKADCALSVVEIPPPAQPRGQAGVCADFVPNGALYLVCTKTFLCRSSLLSENPLQYVMSKENSIDIDTSQDFLKANAMLSEVTYHL